MIKTIRSVRCLPLRIARVTKYLTKLFNKFDQEKIVLLSDCYEQVEVNSVTFLVDELALARST